MAEERPQRYLVSCERLTTAAMAIEWAQFVTENDTIGEATGRPVERIEIWRQDVWWRVTVTWGPVPS